MKNPIIRRWVEYTDGPTEPTADRLYVTLNPRGMLLLNRRAFAELGRPAAAMLLYDERNGAIGLRAAGKSDAKPFPVKSHPKGSHHLVYAKPFCRRFGIRPAAAIRFSDPEIDRDGIMILSLQDCEPVVPKVRRRKDEDL